MGVAKYKYYFKKPKSEIAKDVFGCLCAGGAIAIAASSPYFVQNLIRSRKEFRKYSNSKISSTFDNLRRQGYLSINNKNNQIYISLTKKGKKKAGMFQLWALNIKKPKKWDSKWRLVIFDVPEKRRIVREALRGKLKELGFCVFQKSVWIHPFDCLAEIELLADFFGLSDKYLKLIIAENIGNDTKWREVFDLET